MELQRIPFSHISRHSWKMGKKISQVSFRRCASLFWQPAFRENCGRSAPINAVTKPAAAAARDPDSVDSLQSSTNLHVCHSHHASPILCVLFFIFRSSLPEQFASLRPQNRLRICDSTFLSSKPPYVPHSPFTWHANTYFSSMFRRHPGVAKC